MALVGDTRIARDELIPMMSELGPDMPGDESIVQRTLFRHLHSHGVDPQSITPADLNKAERNMISGFFIGEQRKLLVDVPLGVDVDEVRYVNRVGSPIVQYAGRAISLLGQDLIDTLENGSKTIEKQYSDGTEGKWWPSAYARYGMLGLRAIQLARSPMPALVAGKEKVNIPFEAIDLNDAMSGKTFTSNVPGLVDYVNFQVPTEDTRKKATHDLFYLVTMLAGLHLQEFNLSKGFNVIRNVPIILDSEGIYRADPVEFSKVMRAAYPRIPASELVNAKLKCPAHAQNPGGKTNLEYIGHASVNAAYEHYKKP